MYKVENYVWLRNDVSKTSFEYTKYVKKNQKHLDDLNDIYSVFLWFSRALCYKSVYKCDDKINEKILMGRYYIDMLAYKSGDIILDHLLTGVIKSRESYIIGRRRCFPIWLELNKNCPYFYCLTLKHRIELQKYNLKKYKTIDTKNHDIFIWQGPPDFNYEKDIEKRKKYDREFQRIVDYNQKWSDLYWKNHKLVNPFNQ